MPILSHKHWKKQVVSPDIVLNRIKPGMTIFLGSGVAEPRTLINHLVESDLSNTKDLDLIQLTSHTDVLSIKELNYQNYRLKTFFSTLMSAEAILSENVDLIPGRIAQIPNIISSKRIPIDAAFIQITRPDGNGHCSLGVAVDIAREVMEQATLVVGEINPQIPFTFGDTIVSISDFDLLVESTEAPIYFKRWPFDDTMDKVAANIAQTIDDGDCISLYAGSLAEALAKNLAAKLNLGIHSPYFTDALMDLVASGAVTNYRKVTSRGKSIASYALGTPELLTWLDRNPLVEFQSIDHVFDPLQVGRNPNFVVVDEARKVDLLSRMAFHPSEGDIVSGPGQLIDLVRATEISEGGRTVIGLTSRNADGEPNIVVTLQDLDNLFHMRESIDLVVTEYGIANLKWRSIRERAQALIEIAHPDDREELVKQAKQKKILFSDQIFLSDSVHCFPMEIAAKKTFKGDVRVRFRAIKPSDEDGMRRLFYSFSDEAIYRRYFFRVSTMPHTKMQEYVNIDYNSELSIVGLVQEPEQRKIITEARFAKDEQGVYGNIAFIVDEKYQGIGIASYLYKMLIRLGKERGLKGFTAEVLKENKGMLKVFENGDLVVNSRLQGGIYYLTIPFDEPPPKSE